MKRALAIVLFLLLPAAVASAAIYPGKSNALAPEAKEIGFQNVLQAVLAKKPKAPLSVGWKNGVVVIYQKGGTKTPTEAAATIYVYTSSAKAFTAWQKACAKCKTQSAPAGLKMKAEAGTSNGQLTLHEVTRCANIYLDVIEQNPGNVTTLDSDVAKITNAVFTRATHSGLSSCTAK